MVGTALVLAIFFLVTLLITVLLTEKKGSPMENEDRSRRDRSSRELTERTVRQLTKYGDDTTIKAIISGSIVREAGSLIAGNL
jgi:hypothetical protein